MRRRTLFWVAGAVALAGGIGALRCSLAAPRYRGPVSDHFDGARFRNLEPLSHASAREFLSWRLTREPGPWRPWVPAEPGARPPERVGEGGLRMTFVNHATTLIQMDGINILTDPIWSDRCSPVSWAGPKRVRPAGIRFEDLPPIDVIVISHNHYDHLDVPTLQRLSQDHSPRTLAGLGNSLLLERERIFGAEELDWWQSRRHGAVRFTFVPAQHFSSRGISDRDGNLWGGWVIEGSGGYVYFAGDTGRGPHFRMIRERFGTPRLALLPIGAFLPRWFMAPVHISPEEAIQTHRILGSGTTIPVHYGTFELGDDGEFEAIDAFRAAAQRDGAEGVRILDFGEGLDVP